ncbi:MAG TPA: hypothetical protein VFK13_05725 [Gemmatimonadaceae bacterium]|nr:hypothetical protein [Gemmatimonadaceae bacterium]
MRFRHQSGRLNRASCALRLLVLSCVCAAAARAQGAPSSAHVVRIVAHEYAFEMPDTIRAGLTTLRLRNAGTQPHHLMLYRIDAGKNLDDVFQALAAGGAHPAWMRAVGGPNRGNGIAPTGSAGALVRERGTGTSFREDGRDPPRSGPRLLPLPYDLRWEARRVPAPRG